MRDFIVWVSLKLNIDYFNTYIEEQSLINYRYKFRYKFWIDKVWIDKFVIINYRDKFLTCKR